MDGGKVATFGERLGLLEEWTLQKAWPGPCEGGSSVVSRLEVDIEERRVRATLLVHVVRIGVESQLQSCLLDDLEQHPRQRLPATFQDDPQAAQAANERRDQSSVALQSYNAMQTTLIHHPHQLHPHSL